MKKTICYLPIIAVVLLFSSPAAFTQTASGTPPFSAILGAPDKVNLGNLNVHNDFPVFQKAGRGLSFSFQLGNDSGLWAPVTGSNGTFWEPQSTFGWTGSGTSIGTIGATLIVGSGFFEYCGFTYFDGFGTSHVFPGCAIVTSTTDAPLTTFTLDGTGYKLQADGCGILQGTTCFLVFSLTSVDGSNIIPQNATAVNGSSGAASGSIIDRNGNQITANTNGTFTDTLGTTALTNAGGFPPNPNNLNPPPAPAPYTMTYTTPAGTTTSATLTYKLYQVRTNFGCSGIVEFGASTAFSTYFPDRITLADGSFYQFTYEATPGFPASITGRPASLKLPTGGSITYAYNGTNNGILCSDGSISGLTRSINDGTTTNIWTYTRTQGTGAASTTVMTDPQGNQTVVRFQGIYEAQRQAYQGNSATGTLLQTTNTCYNGSASPCTATAIVLPITSRAVISQFGTRQSKKVTTYDVNHGVMLEEDDYDYGINAPGALLKKTLYTYASFTGSNINSMPATVTVCAPTGTAAACGGSGTVVAQTTYKYDETTPVATTGTPQLVNIGSSSRGNVTTMQTLVQGATTLTRHFTYFDTGNQNTVTDVNGVQSAAYVYGAGSCGNSFPTSITEALGLTRSMTWNCAGGVQTSSTDENGKPTTFTYNDAHFWRPASKTDTSGAVTQFSYPNVNSGEISMTFNSGGSTSDLLQTFDGLGRTVRQQKRQSPGSANFDSVGTDYDNVGRSKRVTLPYSGTAGQANATGPGTTTTYDALGRTLTTTDSGGGSATYTYAQNDVLIAGGPAPAGENSKKRQMEYDGLGRLTSVCEITSGAGSGTCGQSVTQTGYWTRYSYDTQGNLTAVTQNAQAASAAQQTRSYAYDSMRRLISETNPESGAAAYVYDTDPTCGSSAGDRVRRVDAVGNTTCYAYDALHRNTAITYTGPYAANTPNKYFVFDAATIATTPTATPMVNGKGRLAEAYTATCPTCAKLTDSGFSYSARGEVSDVYKASPHSGGYYHLNETYWANGVPSQLSGTPGVPAINYGVDGQGRTSSVSTSSLTMATGVTYNPASRLTQLNLSTGDSDVYGYDANTSRMTQYKFNVASQSVTGNLTWNANATLQQLAISNPFNPPDNQSCQYVYDDLKRVSSVGCAPPGSATASTWQQSFAYDPLGNLSKSGSLNFQPVYTDANGHTNNKYLSVPGCTISYDANGNVLNDCTHTYTWDAEGRPVTTDGTGVTYDALGRMAEQNRASVFTQVVFAPTGEKFALMSGQTLQKAYVPLPGKLTAVYTTTGVSYYRHKDWLGSSRFASTASVTATAGRGSGLVGGSERNITISAIPGSGSAAIAGSEQSTAGGPGTSGSGTVTIAGFERSVLVCDPTSPGCSSCRLRSCGVTVFDSGTVSITVNGHTNSVSYSQGSNSTTIATALAAAINADSAAFVTASAGTNVVTLTAKTTGTATNYSLSSTAASHNSKFTGSSFTATASGTTLTGGTNNTQVFDSGSVSLTVNGCAISAPYQQGSTAATVAAALGTAINGSSCSPVTASVSNLTITLTAKTGGAATNYSLSGGSSTGLPGTFSVPSFTVSVSGAALTGGADGKVTFDTGTVSVAVNGVSTSVSYGQNDTNLTVAGALAGAINTNATAPVTAAVAGGLVVLTAKTQGTATNYSLSATSATNQPGSFSGASFSVTVSGAALTGGSAGAASMYSSTAYAPFGETYAQAGTPDAVFAGMNQDTTGGLYDADQREYGTQGRWPSPDPSGVTSMHLRDPQSLNRYAYSRNNPLSLADPSGMDWCDWLGGCDDGGWGGGGGDGGIWCEGGCAGSLPPIFTLPDPFGISKYPLPGMGCDPISCDDQASLGSPGSGGGPETAQQCVANDVNNYLKGRTDAQGNPLPDNPFKVDPGSYGLDPTGGHYDAVLTANGLTSGQADAIHTALTQCDDQAWGKCIEPDTRLDDGHGLHVEDLGVPNCSNGSCSLTSQNSHKDLFNPDADLAGLLGHIFVDGLWGHIVQWFNGDLDGRCAPN